MKLLITGGAGYIGSHTIIELSNAGHDIEVVDNLCNSSREALTRVEHIIGKSVVFHEVDVCHKEKLSDIFAATQFDGVIHFAGLKAVAESVEQPLAYYQNNLISTLNLVEVMQEHNVKNLIFSSSATVYGTPTELPLRETSPVGIGITNPYGQTKYMIEQILRDVARADLDWHITILRYFNPIGAHESGLIGEDPHGIPNNLFPYITQVATGTLEKLRIFGNDYDTPDGTGLRDFIHVVDLAKGHVAALKQSMQPGLYVYNLGTGQGVSVLQVVKAFKKASGRPIPYEIVPRRSGDIAACYADCQKAKEELGWSVQKSLEDACIDSWRWQSSNPHSFCQLLEE